LEDLRHDPLSRIKVRVILCDTVTVQNIVKRDLVYRQNSVKRDLVPRQKCVKKDLVKRQNSVKRDRVIPCDSVTLQNGRANSLSSWKLREERLFFYRMCDMIHSREKVAR
jgi:hypothetical protein